ncbi:MAG: molybdopterin-dependent oxidoreductase [Gammaproteobacteria bacterium]|nr:molybdopterin-dependent oxidoreductase [Gammaproteobacteria bacterium]
MSTLNYADIGDVVPRVTGERAALDETVDLRIGKLDRRQFLKLTGLVGGGLMLSFSTPRALANAAALQPNGYIKIDATGIVLYAKNPEIGQGVKTSLPMIVAEELDAAWEDVEVVQSAIDQGLYGAQFAGGSMSIPMNWDALRRSGAAARAMLVEAAAKHWGVEADSLSTKDSHVVHAASGRKLKYTELATQAASMPVPDPRSLTLKKRDQFRLLGERITGVDNRALVRGEPLFGIDQTLPGMKYAVYQKCPAIGGKVRSANLEEIKGMPGVNDAFILDGNGNAMELLPGVAIIADNTFAAIKAKRALKVEWDESDASKDSWSHAKAEAERLTNESGPAVVDTGDVDAAFASSGKRTSGFYTYHFVSHATLEPQNCTAWFKDGALDLWAPTQTPGQGIGSAAKVVGISPSKVTLHQLRCGGGFGRRLYNDFTTEAAAIAKRAGVPIKLQWTREDDMAYDLYRAGGFHQMDGSVDDDGKITGWRDRFITFTNDGRRPVSGGGLGAGVFPAGLVDNVRVEQTALPWKNRCAAWRAPGSNVFGFVVQGFLDELAHLAGRDPLEVLLEVLGEPRQMGRRGMHTGRAAGVVRLAAKQAGWGRELPHGHGLGAAFYYSHAGHIAEVAEVSVDDDKRVKVHKVTVAADVGPIVNLSGAENQMQGSVVDGLSTMMGLSVTFENGRVEQSNFDQYPMLRMPSTPDVAVHFVDSDYPPTGLGEPALPPLAPAVCNAIFAACGHRIRTLPISEEGFSLA